VGILELQYGMSSSAFVDDSVGKIEFGQGGTKRNLQDPIQLRLNFYSSAALGQPHALQ
jgi:hypothetical protein